MSDETTSEVLPDDPTPNNSSAAEPETEPTTEPESDPDGLEKTITVP